MPTPIPKSETKGAAAKDSITVADMDDEEDVSMVSVAHERAARYSKYNLTAGSKRRYKNIISDGDDDDDDDDQFDSDMARAIKRSKKEMARNLGVHIGGAFSDVSIGSSDTKTRSSDKANAGGPRTRSSLRNATTAPTDMIESDTSESEDECFQPGPSKRTTRAQTSQQSAAVANQAREVLEISDSEDSVFGPVKTKRSTQAQPRTTRASNSGSKWNIAIPVPASAADAIDLTAVDPDAAFDLLTGLSDNTSESDAAAILDVSDDDDASVVSGILPGSRASRENLAALARARRGRQAIHRRAAKRVKGDRERLLSYHPILQTMWDDLRDMGSLNAGKIEQPKGISRQLKDFQLEGVAWMIQMEKTSWKGGLLGDEMGLGKTIQAVSLIMSDFPAKKPTLVLVPPVALMQWTNEIASYTDGTLTTLVYHGTNAKSKNLKLQDLKKYHVIIMSYNSLESMYRKQEKGFTRKDGTFMEDSIIHKIDFHRIILDEAHSIKTRSTMTAKACFALKADYRWCLTGTPLQNRIGELYSLIRFLGIPPFSSYICKQCPCSTQEWDMDDDGYCMDPDCEFDFSLLGSGSHAVFLIS